MGRPLPSDSKLAPVTQLMLGVDGGEKMAGKKSLLKTSKQNSWIPFQMRCKQGDTLLLLAESNSKST